MGDAASTARSEANRRLPAGLPDVTVGFEVRWLLLLLLVSTLWLAPNQAYALGLRVRATTSLKVEVQEQGRRVDIKVRLTNNVNQGVPNSAVRIELTRTDNGERVREAHRLDVEAPLETDELGYVDRALTLADGEYQLHVYFEDTDNYTGSSVTFPIEVERDTILLELDAPRSVHVAQDSAFDLDVRAALPYSTEPLRVSLELGRGTQLVNGSLALSTQELLSPSADGAARARVRASGRERLETRLLGRGWQPLKVSFAGNENFEPAEAESEVFLFFGPELRFTAALLKERDRRGVVLSGELTSADGPLTHSELLVEVWRGTDWGIVAEVDTDALGRFETFVPQEKLPSGEFKLRMAFVPDVGASLRTKPLVLELDASSAAGWAMWLLIGIFATVLGAMGLYFVVDVVKRWWRRDRRRRSVHLTSQRAELLTSERPPDVPPSRSVRLAGRLFDHHTQRPLAKGKLLLVLRGAGRDATAVREAFTDSNGRFELADLEVERYDLWATRLGYMSAYLSVSVPHDGALEYLRFELESVRARVKAIYQWVLESTSPDEDLWGWTTPRELQGEWVGAIEQMVDALHAPPHGKLAARLTELLSDPSPPLSSLLVVTTALLEAVYFSEHLYPETVAEHAQALAERLQKPLQAATRSLLPRRGSATKSRRRAL